MRIRQLLLVHPSRSIRAVIEKYILAEGGDIEITSCENGENALNVLGEKWFDLVITNNELADMPLHDIKNNFEAHAQNKQIGIIALAGGRNPEDSARLVRAGLANFISPPIDPKDLIGKINQICNPRKWRESERFHIPGSEVVISVWGMEAVSSLINISQGGVLVEVSGDRSELLLQNNPKLDLRIKTPGGYYDIKCLPAKLVRLTAIAWNENYKPNAMQVAYVFLDLESETASELDQIIQLACEDSMSVE